MKLSLVLAVLPALSFASYSKQEYEVGAVHERLMSLKKVDMASCPANSNSLLLMTTTVGMGWLSPERRPRQPQVAIMEEVEQGWCGQRTS